MIAGLSSPYLRRIGIVNKWQLQDAKNRLSEVVRKATDEGPQPIAPRGDDAVVVVAAEQYVCLTRKPKGTLVEFLRKSPLGTVALDLARNRDAGREVVL
jgi:prevent-host-death family protein